MTWIKLRSWHLLRPFNGMYALTLCGRALAGDKPRAAELPADEKSCESCLRIEARAK